MNSNLSYSPETPNLGQIRRLLEPCDLEIWRITLKNDRAPLLSNIKLYASFHHHMWIQTGVTVRKPLCCDLCDLDLWPWPFAWTLLWSLVITPENSMMIRWWEHSQKGVTDGQTETIICRAAWSQLKNEFEIILGGRAPAAPPLNPPLFLHSLNFLAICCARNYSPMGFVLAQKQPWLLTPWDTPYICPLKVMPQVTHHRSLSSSYATSVTCAQVYLM